MNKTPNLLAANTAAWPYWQNPGVQYPNMIPGQQMAGEIADIGINRIPSETDFNQGDIRTIPTPDSPRQQIGESLLMQVHSAEMGRGASVSLLDMLTQQTSDLTKIAENQ